MVAEVKSRVENDYLLIVSLGSTFSNEEYQLLVKRYCDEMVKSGLKKVIIDENNMEYAPSFFLQMDVVEFYSSEELPDDFNTWKVACVGPADFKVYFDFWEDAATKSGHDHRAFASIELAREFMRE